MLKFGTGGFRGIIGDDFSKNNIKLIAQAVIVVYKERNCKKPIHIGYDYRFLSEYAATWIGETLAANGIKVIICESTTTTPEIMYISKARNSDFGIMITASHNSSQYNGVKIFQQEGMDAEKELTDRLEEIINKLKNYKSMDISEAIDKKIVSYENFHEEYIDNILKFLSIHNDNKDLKLLINPLFGTGAITLSMLVEKMGFNNVKFINNKRDCLFSNLMPNPTKENMLLDSKLVIDEKYSLCIGTDSDCDRLGILDEFGNYIDANEILGSIYYYLVKYRGLKGDIVKNLATSNLIDALANKLGFKCHEVDVGFKNISSTLKKTNSLVGGESSGGFTVRNYIFGKDSTFAAALFLEMIINMNKTPSEIIKEVKEFASFNYVISECEIKYKNKDYILKQCENNYPSFPLKITKVWKLNNNFKYYFDNGGWVLLRFSGTEPKIRIFAENENAEIVNECINIVKEFVENIEKENLSEIILNDTYNEIESLFDQIHSLNKNKDALSLPENTYFIKDDRVACFERKNGESRFPYGFDGFYLWATSSGYISANESTFYYILPSSEGNEPYINYYAGIKKKNKFVPISLLGVGRIPNEKNVTRCTVYSKEAVYYLTETKEAKFCVRIYVNENKQIVSSVFALPNKNDVEIYISSYHNCLFKYQSGECFETKWFKKATYKNDNFLFESPEDLDRKTHIENFGLVQREINAQVNSLFNTTSKNDYLGGKNVTMNCSSSLRNGEFELNRDVTRFTDNAVASDIIHLNLTSNSRIDYVISAAHIREDIENILNNKIDILEIDEYVNKRKETYLNRSENDNMLSFNFASWNNELVNPKSLNKFLDYIIYQVEYCALAKNSGTIFLGVRDVIQQLEALLIWNPYAAKEKIKEVLGVLDPTGRSPRQYSLPPVGVDTARMDLREFIDQNVWIISTIYTYLAYTNDYSFLEEECGYFEINGPSSSKRSSIRESVLSHLIRIMDYLESKIDYEYTHCLRTLYGDWNDALDGLGATNDEGKEYGSGVSVMASLQYYKNLNEIIDILSHYNPASPLIVKYKNILTKLENGLLKYAIVTNGNERKIIHGWGDKLSYFVGSYNDVDNLSRDSLTANAFFVLSNLIQKDMSLKENILQAYKRLDSKYGLKTFNPHFEENVKGVGRIVHLPKGTAENGATYIHATMFAIDSLFNLGEGEFALEQLNKVLPLTHKNISTTPFVMPNSYVHNEEEFMDGESMSDWYTGSATTFIKTLVRGLFGFKPDLDGVKIILSNKTPSSEMSMKLKIKNTQIRVNYSNGNSVARLYYVNGKKIDVLIDELSNNKYIYLTNEFIDSNKEIIIEIKE